MSLTEAPKQRTFPFSASIPNSQTIQSIDYSWGEIEFEVSPINRLMKSCTPVVACADSSYELDIEPDDVEVNDTVTVVWEIE